MLGLAICATIAISAAVGAAVGYGARVAEAAFLRQRVRQLAARLTAMDSARRRR